MRDYELIDELGKGTYSSVFKARRLSDNRVVALKQLELPPGLDSYQETTLLDRFRAEADTARKLNHPNIVSIVDAGDDEGAWYIAFEYMEGKTLRDELNSTGRFSPAKLASIAKQLSEALAYAHDNGVIHRDIKPENIILQPDGRALITDFGVATFLGRETRSEDGAAFIGTPQYASPEQVTASRVDGRSDIFSLGVTLYEMASGRPAFGGDSLGEVIHKITAVQAEPLRKSNPSFPPQLENVIFKCLAKDPSFRYQSANDLTLALMDAMPGLSSTITNTYQPKPPASGEASLIILSGSQEGRDIKLHPSITTIGRKTGDITFPDDDSLDNQHAWITKEDAGYFLYDAGTKTGTFVAGRRVERMGLNNGDEITIGKQKLMYSGQSTGQAVEPKPLTPKDVLPPKKKLLPALPWKWVIPSVAAILVVIILVYFLSIAPTMSLSRVDTRLDYLYNSWAVSFADIEFTSAGELTASAQAYIPASPAQVERDLSDAGGLFKGSSVERNKRLDRFEFIKSINSIPGTLADTDLSISQMITTLDSLATDIRQFKLNESSEEWGTRMLKATSAIEKYKSLIAAATTPARNVGISRDEVSTSLYKAYTASSDPASYSPEQIWGYLTDAEDDLIRLKGDPLEIDFAEYNLSVCYYLMGSNLLNRGDDNVKRDAVAFFEEAKTLVSRFSRQSALTKTFQVTGISDELYNPSILTAKIDLALDKLKYAGLVQG